MEDQISVSKSPAVLDLFHHHHSRHLHHHGSKRRSDLGCAGGILLPAVAGSGDTAQVRVINEEYTRVNIMYCMKKFCYFSAWLLPA